MVEEEQGCIERTIEINEKDLPLCCPQLDKRLWDAHPRVYLPIEKAGEIICTYCGTQYVLKK